MATLDFRTNVNRDYEARAVKREADRRQIRLVLRANEAITECIHRGSRDRAELMALLSERVDLMVREPHNTDGEYVAWLGLALAELDALDREDQA